MRFYSFAIILCLPLMLLVRSTNAENVSQPTMVPFVIPWDDAAPGTATDMSFLNAKPAGANGFIVVKDGHFAESKTGKRVRFLGTNFAFMANYPEHAEADKIAAHIAKLGINIVRIHHHDMNWNTALWIIGKGDFREKFDPAGVDKLDYLIAALKKNGVYVDLNLHVSRWYSPENGFPASVKQLPFADKGIDEINRHMIDLQKEFAKNYLGRVNPYTGLSYVDDPAVALVEINNENSLAGDPKSGTSFINSLPAEFKAEVVKDWNDYLVKKYHTTVALKAAWIAGAATVDGPSDLLGANHVWYLADHSAKDAKLTIISQGSATTMPDIDVFNPTVSNPDWAKSIMIQKIPFEEGTGYKVTFRARSDKPRKIVMTATNPDGAYPGIGLRAHLSIGTEWAPYSFSFAATGVSPSGPGCLTFIIGGDTGTLSIADMRIARASGDDAVPAGATLEAGNLDIPDLSTPVQRADWRAFMVDSETAYMTEMRDYLRNDLKVHALITGSQVGDSYSGMASIHREAASDYSDAHAYWQHPHFPAVQFDRNNWDIPNTPMAEALARWIPTTFDDLAPYRVANKPFTVSEYCHPAPNDYQAEMFPEIIPFAGQQDFDAIFEFDYGDYGSLHTAKSRDVIQNYFAMQANPAKEGFTPIAALIFREGLFSPITSKAVLHVSPNSAYTLTSGGAIKEWRTANKGKLPNMLTTRLEVAVDPRVSAPSITYQKESASDSSINVGLGYDGSQFVASSPNALTAAGYFGAREMDFGPMQATCPPFGNNFASLMLAALDSKPLTGSHHLLLSICGKAENIGMGWNDSRTTIEAAWGHGPVQAEAIPATLTIDTPNIKHAWALDPTGARSKEVPVSVSGGKATVTVGAQYQTIWYEFGE